MLGNSLRKRRTGRPVPAGKERSSVATTRRPERGPLRTSLPFGAARFFPARSSRPPRSRRRPRASRSRATSTPSRTRRRPPASASNLPKPELRRRPSDCADIDVLNTLDGFNIQPRDLGAVLRADRPRDGLELDGLPRRPRLPEGRDQPGRLGARSEHAPLRERPAARPERRPIFSSSRTASTPPTASRSTRRRSGTTSTSGRRRTRLRRRTASRCSTLCRWRGPSACRATTSPLRASSRRRPSPRSRTRSARRSRRRRRRARRFDLGSAGERTVFPLSSLATVILEPPERHDDVREHAAAAGRALGIRPRRLDGRVRVVRSRPTTRTADKLIPAYGTATRNAGTSRRRTRSGSRSSCPRAPNPQAAGPSRSSATASATRATVRRGSSPRRSRAAASPRSRSTSSATAAARSGRYTVNRTGGLPSVDLSDGGRAIDQNGNGAYRLDRGRERRRRRDADPQPRRAAADRLRHHAARADAPGRRRRRR